MDGFATAVLVLLAVALLLATLLAVFARHRSLGGPADRATFHTLHAASQAAVPLREGLTTASAERALRSLRSLLSAPGLVLSDRVGVLGWEGTGAAHREEVVRSSQRVLESGATRVDHLRCDDADCRLRDVITVPLTIDGEVVGTLQSLVPAAGAAVIRATNEVAGWVSGQLELSAIDQARSRLVEAELKALRAQISPHFIYNALSAIASFVRTDPERARDLLVEFADFTRYSFRRHGDYATLADELKASEQFLLLERARFGDHLRVTLQVAPECLSVAVPYLSLQPIIENAVRHGLEPKSGPGHLRIHAFDDGQSVLITVEDDGVGEQPERMQRALDGAAAADSIGLVNVDERLRASFGDDYGLVIETEVGAGTKVAMRVAKFAPRVHASGGVDYRA